MKTEFKITSHELVPKHEILTPDETRALLEKYKITTKQLPKILDTDPVIEEIGAQAGDVLRITRKSETAGEATYYRIVVKDLSE